MGSEPKIRCEACGEVITEGNKPWVCGCGLSIAMSSARDVTACEDPYTAVSYPPSVVGPSVGLRCQTPRDAITIARAVNAAFRRGRAEGRASNNATALEAIESAKKSAEVLRKGTITIKALGRARRLYGAGMAAMGVGSVGLLYHWLERAPDAFSMALTGSSMALGFFAAAAIVASRWVRILSANERSKPE